MRARLQRSLQSLSGAGEPGPEAPVLAPLPSGTGPPAPRPLSPEVRDRLEHRLRPPGPDRQPGRWKRMVPGAGVAAAIAVLAAIVVPQLVNSPSRPRGTFAAKAAGPSRARLGLSHPSTAPNGRSGGKGEGVPGGVPGRSGPARFAPSRSGPAPVPGRAERGPTAPSSSVPSSSVPSSSVPSSSVPSSSVPSSSVPSSSVPRSGVARPGVARPGVGVPGPATGPQVSGRPAAVPGPVAAVVEPPVVTGVRPGRALTAEATG